MEKFCVECKEKRTGKFCIECGGKLYLLNNEETPTQKPLEQRLFSVTIEADPKEGGKCDIANQLANLLLISIKIILTRSWG